MKTMKKAAAVVAAIGLTVTGSGVSLAATTEAAATAVSYKETSLSDGGTADSVITGHIKVTSISVKVPVTSSFDIDPNKSVAAGGDANAQMIAQASNYTITNLSLVPLEVKITKVAPQAGVTLVDTVAALDTTKKGILFAVREASEASVKLPSAAGDTKWMTSAISTSKPYSVGKTKLEAAGTTGGADALAMKVYAATKNGWNAGDSFTVTPTFTVSLYTTP